MAVTILTFRLLKLLQVLKEIAISGLVTLIESSRLQPCIGNAVSKMRAYFKALAKETVLGRNKAAESWIVLRNSDAEAIEYYSSLDFQIIVAETLELLVFRSTSG